MDITIWILMGMAVRKKLSEKQVAEMVGVSRPYLNAISCGKKNVTIAQLERIADELVPPLQRRTGADGAEADGKEVAAAHRSLPRRKILHRPATHTLNPKWADHRGQPIFYILKGYIADDITLKLIKVLDKSLAI